MDSNDIFKMLTRGAKFASERREKDKRPQGLEKADVQEGGETTSDTCQPNNKNEKHVSKMANFSGNTVIGTQLQTSDQLIATPPESQINILRNVKSKEESVLINHPKKKSSQDRMRLREQEKVNIHRKQNHIHVYGSDITNPVTSIADLRDRLSIHSRIIDNIKSINYDTLTPVQMQTIPVMIQRREVMVCAPTGSGKTAAFIIPVLHHLREPRNLGFRAVILSPTRELAKQTYRWLLRISDGIGFRIFYIEKMKSMRKIAGSQASKKCDILVTTPSRLVYLLSNEPPLISLTSVEWLIVDECDKLFEEGKTGFRNQLAMIYKACSGQSVCRGLFSATFAYEVEEWCKENLNSVIQVYIGGRNTAVQNVKQELLYVGCESGKLLAMRDMIQAGLDAPVLIFVQSRDRAKQLFQEMLYDGIHVDVIHSDRTQRERDNVVRSFRCGDIWVLICTELMGRGIDFQGVRLVINFDFPSSAISYIHRIGRTGRAGNEGKAVTFFTDDDFFLLRNIANVMREAGCPVPDYMVQLRKHRGKEKRKLAKRVLDREDISTVPQGKIWKSSKQTKSAT